MRPFLHLNLYFMIAYRHVELAVIYQNRAATNERLEKFDEGLKDCDESIKLNNR